MLDMTIFINASLLNLEQPKHKLQYTVYYASIKNGNGENWKYEEMLVTQHQVKWARLDFDCSGQPKADRGLLRGSSCMTLEFQALFSSLLSIL